MTVAGLRALVKWIASRYTRPAFPDEFNRRLAAADRKLERLWKNARTAVVTNVFVASSNEEFPESRNYGLAVRLTAPRDRWDSAKTRESLDFVVERLEKILEETQGFGEIDVRAIPEEDFPISELRFFKRLDRDYRTLPTDDDRNRPPDQIDES